MALLREKWIYGYNESARLDGVIALRGVDNLSSIFTPTSLSLQAVHACGSAPGSWWPVFTKKDFLKK